MLSRRFIAILALAAVALATMVVAGRVGSGGCSSTATDVRAAPPVVPAGETPTPGGSPTADGGTATPGATSSAGVVSSADALEAVRALKHFCDLVGAHRLHAAAKLLAGPWVWPRRELLPISRLRLVSAKVQDGRQGDTVVLRARLRAHLRGPSPLHDGINTLFFTLGRDGTTGGWLIAAVTSSP